MATELYPDLRTGDQRIIPPEADLQESPALTNPPAPARCAWGGQAELWAHGGPRGSLELYPKRRFRGQSIVDGGIAAG